MGVIMKEKLHTGSTKGQFLPCSGHSGSQAERGIHAQIICSLHGRLLFEHCYDYSNKP